MLSSIYIYLQKFFLFHLDFMSYNGQHIPSTNFISFIFLFEYDDLVMWWKYVYVGVLIPGFTV